MKIRLISLLLVLALPCLTVAQETAPHPLEGTWKLVKSKWGDMKDFQVPTRDVYKIFTRGHFFFVYYGKENFSGAGGGTYVANDKTFQETLAYFSWDSSSVGTQQTFNWTMEGNQLHQSGFLNMDKYDNYVIEEYYERVENGISSDKNSPLAGVWRIEQATYGQETQTAQESDQTIYKIFTPKHWYAVFYNKHTGAFDGMGFGDYRLKGNKYIETSKAFSWDQSGVGSTTTFAMEIAPLTLVQRGKINTEKYKDFTVVEQFVRVE